MTVTLREWLGARLPWLDPWSWAPGRLERRARRKVDGGIRWLAVPSPADRGVQQEVLCWAGQRVDPTFHPTIHGWRPGRGVTTAVAALEGACATEWLGVVGVDVCDLFGTLPHDRLRHPRLDGDPLWRHLLGTWLRVWRVGVPQGAPLSPLLANLVLDAVLDRPLDGLAGVVRRVRYGDDLHLVATSPGHALAAVARVEALLRAEGMALQPRKTSVVGPGVPLRVLGVCMHVRRRGGSWVLGR